MRISIRIMQLLLIVQIFSCNSEIDHSSCQEVTKIEVFSLGFPNITLAGALSEKEVRKNLDRVILDRASLKKIESLVDNLSCIDTEEKWSDDIMVVCDFYCKGGGKYTLLYNSFVVKINDNFYCSGYDLVDELVRGHLNHLDK